MEIEEKTVYDLIYLMGCGVNGIPPRQERVQGMELEQVHALAALHSLSALSCMALEEAYGGRLPEAELFRTWAEEKNQAIYRTVLFAQEREQVLAFLEGAGIWYLPLKGIWFQELYPRLGMRQMADNDILFDSAYQEQVHDWFLARGYRAEEYRTGNHDSYHKEPIYNFEMHTALFGRSAPQEWRDSYGQVKGRLLSQEGTGYGCRFREEDRYVYLTVHACKHYHNGGTGLRTLLDCYVYLSARGDGLDWAYVRTELEKLGVASFEEQIRGLSRALFARPEELSPAALTQKQGELLGEFLPYGTYGTLENRLRSKVMALEPEGAKLTGRSKAKYVWRRLFPDMEIFREYYPFFYRHRWLMPVGWAYRLVYKGVVNRKKLRAEVKTLKKL